MYGHTRGLTLEVRERGLLAQAHPNMRSASARGLVRQLAWQCQKRHAVSVLELASGQGHAQVRAYLGDRTLYARFILFAERLYCQSSINADSGKHITIALSELAVADFVVSFCRGRALGVPVTLGSPHAGMG